MVNISNTAVGDERLRKRLEAQRSVVRDEFASDPYLGYATVAEALSDYKCTTQVEALSRMLNRENVFLSGPAGSGKTTLIKKFIDIVDAEYDGVFEVALTASTGVAATLIGGSTIHSWAGLGIDTEPFDPKNISPFMWNKANNLRFADVLIIDEISMLPAYLFEKLDLVLQYFRRNKDPFGGVQVILMGDFLQLPPVDKGEAGVNAGFVATTSSWKDLSLSYCYMDKTHRATDPRLQSILTKISNNRVDQEAKEIVNSRIGQTPDPKKSYTTLFTTNSNVDAYNTKELAANSNPPTPYHIRTGGEAKYIKELTRNLASTLTLKVGATVILTSNTTYGTKFYPNGAIGEVMALRATSVQVRFNDGNICHVDYKRVAREEKEIHEDPATKKPFTLVRELAWVEYLPLKLGYAITVHKSQGQTLDGVVVDLTKCFTAGLGYVALSRVRSLDDLVVKGISDNAYKVDATSFKLSTFVKKKALVGRAEFEAKMDIYEGLLTNLLLRGLMWNTDDCGAVRRSEREKRR